MKQNDLFNKVFYTIFFLCIFSLKVVFSAEPTAANKYMAAYNYTVVCTRNELGSSALLTYPLNEYRVQEYNFFVKIHAGIDY